MKNLLLFFLIISLVIFSFFFLLSHNPSLTKEVKAGSGDNVYGWAWAGVPQVTPPEKLGLGWISFNCDNPELPTPRCSNSDYGVNIEDPVGNQANITGYAYFDMNDPNSSLDEVGWIDFNPSGPYPTCPGSTCPGGSPDYSARFDINNRKITGWARALNSDGGWDGWILLGPIEKGGTDYGVEIDNNGEFHGWAWGDEVMGWISFNCDNPESGDVCGSSDYKVYTGFTTDEDPTVSNLDTDAKREVYCSNNPSHYFSWDFSDPEDGTTQTAYRLQVDTSSNFTPPLDFDSGTTTSASQERYAPVRISPGVNELAYNTNYYWQIKVWDSSNNDSGWVKYDPNGDDVPDLFSTPAHHYPDPDFTHSPENPAAGEVVTFEDKSVCYDPGSVDNECSQSPNTGYEWDFSYDSDDGFIVEDTTKGDATTTYDTSGEYIVKLRVYDYTLSGNPYCESQGDTPINATPPLPEWEEIPPY